MRHIVDLEGEGSQPLQQRVVNGAAHANPLRQYERELAAYLANVEPPRHVQHGDHDQPADDVEPACLVARRLDAERQGRARLAPLPVAAARHDLKLILARRKIRVSGLPRRTGVHPVTVVAIETIAIAHAHRIRQRKGREPDLQMGRPRRKLQEQSRIERARVGGNRFDPHRGWRRRLAEVAGIDDRYATARDEPQPAVVRSKPAAAPLAEWHSRDAIRGVEQPEADLIVRVVFHLVDFARVQSNDAAVVAYPDEPEPVLHDGLDVSGETALARDPGDPFMLEAAQPVVSPHPEDRKSTRLNSSHSQISYAVFCSKKK